MGYTLHKRDFNPSRGQKCPQRLLVFQASDSYSYGIALVVERSRLFKKVIIHDSDNENDFYAKRGLSKLKARIFPADRSMTIFDIISRFTRWGVNLVDLTINIDEEEPGVADHVRFEQNLILRSRSSAAKRREWRAYMEQQERKAWTKNWSLSTKKVPTRRVRIQYVLVRGTDAVADGHLDFGDAPGRSEKLEDVYISGNYRPSSKVATYLTKYFSESYKVGLLANFPMISFSGKFHQRRLRDDGSFVKDDELDAWLAENILNENQIKETEEQLDAGSMDELPYFM